VVISAASQNCSNQEFLEQPVFVKRSDLCGVGLYTGKLDVLKDRC